MKLDDCRASQSPSAGKAYLGTAEHAMTSGKEKYNLLHDRLVMCLFSPEPLRMFLRTRDSRGHDSRR